MTNDEKRKAAQRQLVIHLDQPFEVRYWTRALGVDERTLRELVSNVGPSADKIREHLGGD